MRRGRHRTQLHGHNDIRVTFITSAVLICAATGISYANPFTHGIDPALAQTPMSTSSADSQSQSDESNASTPLQSPSTLQISAAAGQWNIETLHVPYVPKSPSPSPSTSSSAASSTPSPTIASESPSPSPTPSASMSATVASLLPVGDPSKFKDSESTQQASGSDITALLAQLDAMDPSEALIGIRADKLGADKWGGPYAPGNCTWYAYARRAELGHPIPKNWGDAGHWATAAQAAGFKVSDTPSVGDVMTDTWESPLGHVAVVEKVYDDQHIAISEMNNASFGGLGNRDIRRVDLTAFSQPVKFIGDAQTDSKHK